MAKHFVTLLWLSAALTATLALPTSDKANGSENDLVASIYTDCLKKESISCIKYKVFTFVDKMLADKEDITLSEGITVVKTSNAEGEGAPRSIESNDLDTLLFDRLGRFLRTHSVKVDLKGSDILGAIESAGRGFEDFNDNAVESRGKKSEKGAEDLRTTDDGHGFESSRSIAVGARRDCHDCWQSSARGQDRSRDLGHYRIEETPWFSSEARDLRGSLASASQYQPR
ncbi:uncharacterized protein LOC105198793 isoform X2 [Solenopsis invicta]|uniref:uncharacterized protein LOC105198793 isoform X2 n=1 Tax=Solenopsis invicta TaxID=13686 RepID=UPI00193CF4ED|nr:uncharacterized protein LOC105198793 isoform X2 [Solenopsis invicta]